MDFPIATSETTEILPSCAHVVLLKPCLAKQKSPGHLLALQLLTQAQQPPSQPEEHSLATRVPCKLVTCPTRLLEQKQLELPSL